MRRYLTYIGFGLAIIAALVGIGFGCAAFIHEATKERPNFNTGQVVDRHYSPAHTDLIPQLQYAGESCYYNSSSKSNSCTPQYRTVLIPIFVSDKWSIQIKNCSVFKKDQTQWVNKDGSPACFTKWITVDQTQYDQIQLGEQWGAQA